MKPGQRIPTPLKHRWRRFRYGTLPGICFVACLALTLWLWKSQGRLPNAVGEVESLSVPVAAPIDGILQPRASEELAKLSGEEKAGWWKRFEQVEKGVSISRVRNPEIERELAVLKADLPRIEKEIASAKEQLDFDSLRLNDPVNVIRTEIEYVTDYERLRLDVVDRQTEIATDTIALQRLNIQLNYLEGLAAKDVAVGAQLDEIRLQRDETQRRIAGNEAAIEEAKAQMQRAKDRWEGLPQKLATKGAESIDFDTILAPLRAEVATQEIRIDSLQRQIDLLEIKAPFSGTISQVYLFPGQHVRAGDPILMLSRNDGDVDGDGEKYIISYVRQTNRIRPKEGASVQLRPRMPGARAIAAKVASIGPQYEPVPLRQLTDPTRPEFGLPVRILVPDEMRSQIRPGELIDVRF